MRADTRAEAAPGGPRAGTASRRGGRQRRELRRAPLGDRRGSSSEHCGAGRHRSSGAGRCRFAHLRRPRRGERQRRDRARVIRSSAEAARQAAGCRSSRADRRRAHQPSQRHELSASQRQNRIGDRVVVGVDDRVRRADRGNTARWMLADAPLGTPSRCSRQVVIPWFAGRRRWMLTRCRAGQAGRPPRRPRFQKPAARSQAARTPELSVARYVFERDLPAENVLHHRLRAPQHMSPPTCLGARTAAAGHVQVCQAVGTEVQLLDDPESSLRLDAHHSCT